MKLKAPAFEPGELLIIPLGSDCFGSARVVARDNFGCLIEIHKARESESSPFVVLDVAYVNRASARKRWRSHRNMEVSAVISRDLKFFYGDTISGWTLVDRGKKAWRSPVSFTREELRRCGYVDKILWLAEDIEKLLRDGTPLMWPGT